MGDRLRASIPPRYVTKPTRSTQPCIPPASLNRIPALIGWGKGGNVTSAGWQVTLCDPIWHVSSRSGEAVCQLLYSSLPLPFLYMHVVITCNYSCQHKKWKKWNKQRVRVTYSNQPGLRPVLHLRTHQLHPLQYPYSTPPHCMIEIPKRSIHFLYFFLYRM